jgi:N-acetylmuramoyl-L-alanine amidase
MQQSYQKQSLNFASYVQQNFEENTSLKNRGVEQAGFLVLYETAMPRVLIETGFISNPEEEKYLNSREGQNQIAHSIYEAFREYKQKLESESVLLTNVSGSETVTDGVVFKVQLAASRKPIPLDSKFFRGLTQVEEHVVSNRYKYTTGIATDYAEAQQIKNEIKKDFPDAFIVAFENNKPISVKKALGITNNN